MDTERFENIYFTGDSHMSIFININGDNYLSRSRSTTLYTATNDDTLEFKSQNVKDDSIVVISYGEIDIRWRIYEHITKNITKKHHTNIVDTSRVDTSRGFILESTEESVIIEYCYNLIDKFILKLYTINIDYKNIKFIFYLPPLPNDDIFNSLTKFTYFKDVSNNKLGSTSDRLKFRRFMLDRLYYYENLLTNFKVFNIDDIFTNIKGELSINLMDETTLHIHHNYQYIVWNMLQKFIFQKFKLNIWLKLNDVNIEVHDYFRKLQNESNSEYIII
jgi:hypothetical protein